MVIPRTSDTNGCMSVLWGEGRFGWTLKGGGTLAEVVRDWGEVGSASFLILP